MGGRVNMAQEKVFPIEYDHDALPPIIMHLCESGPLCQGIEVNKGALKANT